MIDRTNFEPLLIIAFGKNKNISQTLSASISIHEGIGEKFSILILVNFFL